MTTPMDQDPDGISFQPLDAEAGPALLQTRKQQERMIDAVLNHHFGRKRRRLGGWRAAVIAMISFGALGVAAAVTAVTIRIIIPQWQPDETNEQRPIKRKKHRPVKSHPLSPLIEEEDTLELQKPVQRIGRKKKRLSSLRNKQAADLLARANTLRSKRKWLAAEKVYRDVIKKHPSSDQAYAAMVAAAALRLEQLVDPRGALRLYKQARRFNQGQYLAQESLFGIARCYRALGNKKAEQRVLNKYLNRYPKGPMAHKVRTRLDELSRP